MQKNLKRKKMVLKKKKKSQNLENTRTLPSYKTHIYKERYNKLAKGLQRFAREYLHLYSKST